MSMLCTLSRVSASQMAAMRGDPSVADQLLHEDPPAAAPRGGLFAKLFGKAPPAPPARTVPWIGPAQQYDLDRQWHVLHFLLTGQGEGGPFPASFLCDGGEEVGTDLGYGKPRLFTAEQAGRIADHLRSIAEADLLERYDADVMEVQGVYWQVEDAADERRRQVRELHETIVGLADFAGETARLHAGLVVEIY
jgi:hypothetical protein